MVLDQRPRIVEQHFLGHAAKAAERAFHTREPMLLPLAPKGSDVQAARIAQRGHEEENLLLWMPLGLQGISDLLDM